MDTLKSMLVLWLAGFGIPADMILENTRVKFELEQREIDPVAVLQSIQRASEELTNVKWDERKHLFDPGSQLELIQLVRNFGKA